MKKHYVIEERVGESFIKHNKIWWISLKLKDKSVFVFIIFVDSYIYKKYAVLNEMRSLYPENTPIWF